MAFLIEFNQLPLDINSYSYEEVLGSVLYGREGWSKKIQISKTSEILIHRSCILAIDEKLNCTESSFDSNLHFINFQDYIGKVRSILSLLKNNAVDKNRKHRYGMISTISTGYDSLAVSALAHEQGCNEVITFKEPAHDRGDGIALKLGFEKIYLRCSNEFYYNTKDLEAEACCSGNMGGANFSAFEDLTQGKIIFMGFRGDTIWDKINPNVNDEFDFSKHGFLYDTCLHNYEFCYRTNSVIVPLPMIGLDRWSEVNRISNSEEMKEWSVGGDYDRPIPRRIVEEKGIRREVFGFKKQGAGTSYHFDTYNRLKGKMSKTSFLSLEEFKVHCRRNRIKKICYSIAYYCKEWPTYANYVLNKLRLHYHFDDKNTGKMASPVSSLLFLWGLSVVRKRYNIR